MEKKFEKPELLVISFEKEDVILTSTSGDKTMDPDNDID